MAEEKHISGYGGKRADVLCLGRCASKGWPQRGNSAMSAFAPLSWGHGRDVQNGVTDFMSYHGLGACWCAKTTKKRPVESEQVICPFGRKKASRREKTCPAPLFCKKEFPLRRRHQIKFISSRCLVSHKEGRLANRQDVGERDAMGRGKRFRRQSLARNE